MNFPAIAKKTYDRLKAIEEFAFITDHLIAELKEIKFAISRARFFHKRVDELSEGVFAHPIVKEMSGCTKGCTGCCHTEVSVTDDEAELLALRVKNGIRIDKSRLALQNQNAKEKKNFYTIPYNHRACVFLSEKGICSVYDDRPGVCRTNAVIGNSEQCSTEDGQTRIQRLVRTDCADMAIMGAFLVSPKSGTLGEMLWDKLNAPKKPVLHPIIDYKNEI